ncbi:hypothetical protein RD792_010605 [Penstemon davidsonii]|uniref:Uncharacterized protein n=1 Tax=Penstemon davidsonii TaxID=160366 RepID=A0ABR0D3R6_9LAMI|nr:hypothetical protein RD792_010605 [Penstemon davidsonii]
MLLGLACFIRHHFDQPLQMKTTCGSLLSELQKIWDEVGEDDNERDKMLFQLEQECLDAYRRKVDHANRSRAQLRQQVADSEAQLADICAALGDRPALIKKVKTEHWKNINETKNLLCYHLELFVLCVYSLYESRTMLLFCLKQTHGNLKRELESIKPQLEDMKNKRNERMNQFSEVLKQINSISKELSLCKEGNVKTILAIDESDLSLKKLDDLQNQLLLLQKEKSERLKKVFNQLSALKSLCMVLGLDYKLTIHDIHPTLDDSCDTKSISADTIERLSATIVRQCIIIFLSLFIFQLQDLAMTMVELWNLMDTPVEEQQMFQNVLHTIAASESEITEPNTLSLDFINNAETEVMRLQQMKSSKMKEVLWKKSKVLEEICRGAHMVVEGQFAADHYVEAIESGAISSSVLLDQLEDQILKVEEEAFSRKEILEKVQKWLAACEEECWLEEYNRDDNRYNAGRGTHLMLKRAEKARLLVNKIPAMTEALKSKVQAWEKERGVEFQYDGVGLLSSMVEEYCDLKNVKEQERQRQKDQKKLHGQLMAEQEAIYGSKPSPSKSGNKNFRPSIGGMANKRFSVGGGMLQNTFSEKGSLSSRSLTKNNTIKQQNSRSHHNTGPMAHSSGKKNTSVCHIKQHASNALNSQQTESLPIRKPLSPISSTSFNITSCNFQDQNSRSGEFQNTYNIHKTPVSTPTKNVSATNENRTPKMMPVPMPATPPTASTAMQTAMTPYTPVRVRGTDKVEYSYEERRAGFILPNSQSKPLSLV